jgi:hypothetical protein
MSAVPERGLTNTRNPTRNTPFFKPNLNVHLNVQRILASGSLPRKRGVFFMRRKIRTVLLLFLFPLTPFFFATAPAFANSLFNTPTLEYDQCLITALQGSVESSQTFTPHMHITNTCGVPFSVSIRVNTQMTNCPPFSETSRTVSVLLGDQQTASASPGFTAGCVGCTDGVPLFFPPFDVKITVLAFGSLTIGPTTTQASSNISVTAVHLSNDPHPYVPPCP